MKSSIKASPLLRLPLMAAAMAVLMALAPDGQPTATHADGRFLVVATIAPLQALTAGVMEGTGQPELLMHSGDNPHHYSMRPDDARKLVNADIIICTSRQHEYYLEPLITALPERPHTVVEALAIPGLTLLAAADEDEAPDSHALGKSFADMHFWLDPVNAIAYTQYIAEELSAADPANTARYAENAARQVLALQQLDATIRERLGRQGRKARYVSYHPALAYFEHRYGIEGGRALAASSETGVGAADADALFTAIEKGETACLLQEPEFPPRLMQAAAARFGDKVRLITVDTLGGTYGEGYAAYGRMLSAIADTVAACSEPEGAAYAAP